MCIGCSWLFTKALWRYYQVLHLYFSFYSNLNSNGLIDTRNLLCYKRDKNPYMDAHFADVSILQSFIEMLFVVTLFAFLNVQQIHSTCIFVSPTVFLTLLVTCNRQLMLLTMGSISTIRNSLQDM